MDNPFLDCEEEDGAEQLPRQAGRLTLRVRVGSGNGNGNETNNSANVSASSGQPMLKLKLGGSGPSYASAASNPHSDNGNNVNASRRMQLSSSSHATSGGIASGSGSSPLVGWWALLHSYDNHRLFTSQAAFRDGLGPLGTASAGTFYARMNCLLEQWRRSDWGALALGEASAFRQKAEPDKGITKEAVFEQGRLATVVGCARWHESLRVQRLMAHHLLSTANGDNNSGTSDDDDREEDEVEGSKGNAAAAVAARAWRFEEACPEAVLAATTASTSTKGRPRTTASGSVSVGGGGTTSQPQLLQLRLPRLTRSLHENGAAVDLRLLIDGTDTSNSGGRLVAAVPSAARVLLLLRVLDDAWADPCFASFRLPVTEWEAPGYYKRVKDPVCLLSLYDDVFRGCLAPVGGSYASQQSSLALSSDGGGVGVVVEVSAAAEWDTSVFTDYAALKGRLATLRANCLLYNGDGSPLAGLAADVCSRGVRATRDAQAEEEGQGRFHAMVAAARRHGARGVVPTTGSNSINNSNAFAAPSSGGETPLPLSGNSHCLIAPLSLEALLAAFPSDDKAAGSYPVPPPVQPFRRLTLTIGPTSTATATATGVGRMKPTEKRQAAAVVEVVEAVEAAPGKRPRGRPSKAATTEPAAAVAPKKRGRKGKNDNDAPAAITTTTTKDDTVFRLRCDRCGQWRQLPCAIDPPPPYWECSYMGGACDAAAIAAHAADAAMKKMEKKRPSEASFADLFAVKTARAPGSRRRARSPSLSSSSSSSSLSSSSSDSDSDSGASNRHRRVQKSRKKKEKTAIRNDDGRNNKKGKSRRASKNATTATRAKSAAAATITRDELAQLEKDMTAIEAEAIGEDPSGILARLRALERRV